MSWRLRRNLRRRIGPRISCWSSTLGVLNIAHVTMTDRRRRILSGRNGVRRAFAGPRFVATCQWVFYYRFVAIHLDLFTMGVFEQPTQSNVAHTTVYMHAAFVDSRSFVVARVFLCPRGNISADSPTLQSVCDNPGI